MSGAVDQVNHKWSDNTLNNNSGTQTILPISVFEVDIIRLYVIIRLLL